MKWLICLVAAMLLAGSVRAQEPEDVYLDIHRVIDQADLLRSTGQTEPAKAKYEQAQTALVNFKKNYPTWNPKVVAYRLNYLAEKIDALSPTNPAPAQTTAAGTEAPRSGVSRPEPKKAVSAPPSGIQVKLLAAGAEPRKPLRLHATAGEKQTTTMTMDMMMDMQAGDIPGQEMKLPAMQLVFDVEVKNVSADGLVTYQTTVSDASVTNETAAMPQVVEAMKASMAGLKGLTSSGTVTDRGFNKVSDIKVPAGADPQVRQSMDQMKEALSTISAPLPEEAVGVGGRWEVKQPIKSQGMTINQTATYQLVSIDNDRVTLKTTLVQNAANQKMHNPTMPGVAVDLTKMTGTGTGETILDLGHILPAQATVDSHSEMFMGMNAGGQKQTITLKMDLKLRLQSQ